MSDVPVNAPACFAAASVFGHDSKICQQCCVYDACSAAALKTLEAISGIVNVEDLLKRHERARLIAQEALKKADEKATAELPPGNVERPLMKPVERKTQVVNVQFEVSADKQNVIATLPLKSKAVALSMCKTGQLNRILKGIEEGRNALTETGPHHLRVTLDMLLDGGFARRELTEALKKELGWAEGTAASYVSMMVAILPALDIAQETEGRFALIPKTVA